MSMSQVPHCRSKGHVRKGKSNAFKYRNNMLRISQHITDKTAKDLKCYFKEDSDFSDSQISLLPPQEVENCTLFEFLMKLGKFRIIEPTNTSALQEPLEICGMGSWASVLKASDQEQKVLENVHDEMEDTADISTIQHSDTLVPMFHKWWGDLLERPIPASLVLSSTTCHLISYLLTGQYHMLFKTLTKNCLKDCGPNVIVLNLGDGLYQHLPAVDVHQANAESLLQLMLEGVLMADNACHNLEALRQGTPDMPYPLYLLYKAKLSSTSGSQEDCEWVYKECKSLKAKKDIHISNKHCAWLQEALGLTVRHAITDFDEGWSAKANFHRDAYNIRNDCSPKDEIESILKQSDLAKAKQSHGFAYAYMGTNGNYNPTTKMEYNELAKEKHGEAIQTALYLLKAVGMHRELANPSNFVITLRLDGMLRNLRIKQTELLMHRWSEAERGKAIAQQRALIEGEQGRMKGIIESRYSNLDEILMRKIHSEFHSLLADVGRGVMRGFTLDNTNISE